MEYLSDRTTISAAGDGRRSPGRSWGELLAAALLVLGFAAAETEAAEPRLQVSCDRSEVALGNAALLTVELEGFSGGAQVEIPSVDGLDIYEAGRSTNVQLVNGRFSSSITYTYQLLPRREGTFSVGPIRVTDKGRAHASDPVSLRAVGRATPPPGAPRAGPPAGAEPEIRGEQEGLFARVEVTPREAYPDQQVILRFRLYRRADVPLIGTRDFAPPTTEGFWREDLGPERSYTVEIDGQTYGVTELAWALFPTREGELEIGPARLVCYVEQRSARRSRDPFSDFFDRDFFGRGLHDQRAVELRTDPVRVRVRPLPEEGRPPDFSGSVGDYTIQAAFDAASARQGDPIGLTVTIRGSGHIQTIAPPAWPAWKGWRVYDSGDAVSLEKKDDRLVGAKQFTQVLVPERSGELTIDPIRFVFFDPQSRRYRTVTTDFLRIVAAPAGARATDSGGGGTILPLGDEILYIRSDVLRTLTPRSEGLGWRWLVHLIPLAAIGAAGFVRHRRGIYERDPALGRRSRAARRAAARLPRIDPRRAPHEFARELAELIEDYLSDWLGREVRGMRRTELEGAMGDAGIAAESIAEAIALLDWADGVRFASAPPGDPAARRQALGRLLGEMEAALRRAAPGAALVRKWYV